MSMPGYIASLLRCAWCDRFDAPHIDDGHPCCHACYVASHPRAPSGRRIPKRTGQRNHDAHAWVREARFIRTERRPVGAPVWIYEWHGEVMSAGCWAAYLGITRQGLSRIRKRILAETGARA